VLLLLLLQLRAVVPQQRLAQAPWRQRRPQVPETNATVKRPMAAADVQPQQAQA
jgi:hypothetical protein